MYVVKIIQIYIFLKSKKSKLILKKRILNIYSDCQYITNTGYITQLT